MKKKKKFTQYAKAQEKKEERKGFFTFGEKLTIRVE